LNRLAEHLENELFLDPSQNVGNQS
jgi:hypothetical protein